MGIFARCWYRSFAQNVNFLYVLVLTVENVLVYDLTY